MMNCLSILITLILICLEVVVQHLSPYCSQAHYLVLIQFQGFIWASLKHLRQADLKHSSLFPQFLFVFELCYLNLREVSSKHVDCFRIFVRIRVSHYSLDNLRHFNSNYSLNQLDHYVYSKANQGHLFLRDFIMIDTKLTFDSIVKSTFNIN